MTGILFGTFLGMGKMAPTLGLLSPSFYQPENLLKFSMFNHEDSQDFISLAGQFNSYEAWLKLPHLENRCVTFLESSSDKRLFLLYARSRIILGQVSSAIFVLEKAKKFKCGDIYRLVSISYFPLSIFSIFTGFYPDCWYPRTQIRP